MGLENFIFISGAELGTNHNFFIFLQHLGPKGEGDKFVGIFISLTEAFDWSEFSMDACGWLEFSKNRDSVSSRPQSPPNRDVSVMRTRTEFLRRPLVPKGKADHPPKTVCSMK